jgi:hypothetical protein
MSIASCLSRLLQQGKISAQQAADARAIHDGLLNEDILRNMDQASAEAYAALKTAEIMERTAAAKKLELARRSTLYNANLERINAHPDGPLAGFMALYDRDIRKGAGGINVSAMEEDYAGRIAQKMHATDEAYSSKAAGLKQNVTGIRDMVREMFNVRTGDTVAAHAARGWREAADWGVARAQQLGKIFEPTENWRLPQFWNSGRVNKIGAAEFRADLDTEISGGALQVYNPDTGRVAKGAERAQIVSTAIDNIRKDLSRRAGTATVFKEENRVFRFVDGQAGADAYLHLMDKYGPGQGGYYAMLQSHAQKMARELALLHVLGPSPRAQGEALLKAAVENDAQRSLDMPKGTIMERIGNVLTRGIGLEGRVAAERLHKYMTGQLSGIESETVAGIFQGARSFLTSTSMGSAIITAVPADTVNWTMAANYRGLNTGRLVQAVTDQFLADTPDKAAMAARIGIVAHAASRAAIATKQYGDEIVGRQIMPRLADFVIRAQGLHAWDSAIKRAFTMEFLASIGERTGKGFDELDAPFASFMKDYGFTAADWSALSRGQVMDAGPAKFLMPDALDESLRAKLMSAIYDERQFAYLAGGSNRVRAVATGGAKSGTVGGEAIRSFYLFKQFPLTMAATWGMRATQDAAQGNVGVAVQLGVFMTIAGALALQARQVLQGKDPHDMKDGWFWGEAALQGGAAGFYGDFLKEAFSRSGTSLTEGALGPLAAIPAAAQRLTSGARRAAEEGQHVNFGAALADDVARFTPGASSMWWGRLAFNRMVVDNIKRTIDPDYSRSFQRARDRAQKLHGQQFWWGPGDTSPVRAPDAGAMVR